MRFVKIVDWIDRIFRVLIIIAFMGSLATIGTSIFFRNVLARSFPWSEEVAKYLTIFIVFCTAAIAARNNGLTRLTFLTDLFHLKERGARVLEWMIGLVCIAFYILVFYSAWKFIGMLQKTHQLSAALKIPQWIPLVSLVVGTILLVLNTLACLIAGKDNEAIERSEAE